MSDAFSTKIKRPFLLKQFFCMVAIWKYKRTGFWSFGLVTDWYNEIFWKNPQYFESWNATKKGIQAFWSALKIRWMNGSQDTEFKETSRMCGNWQISRGLFTNYVDKILAFSTLRTLTKNQHFWTTYPPPLAGA